MDIFFGAVGSVLAVLLLTSFVKFLTTLNILRYGIGLGDAPFGLVIVAVSLGLTALVFSPKIEQAGGVDNFFKANATAATQLEKNFRPFLEQHTDKSILKRMNVAALKTQKKDPKEAKTENETPTPFSVLISAFLISELKVAFSLGLMLLIPFVVVDIAVGNILMALGTSQLPAAVVSLPIKLLLFLAADGWALVSEKLLASY